MKGHELAGKMMDPSGLFEEEAERAAKSAFLANLTEILGIETPEELRGESDKKKVFSFYAGCIAGWKAEIKEEDIRKAHLSMIFIWSRAIVSSALGHKTVDYTGFPKAYGATA